MTTDNDPTELKTVWMVSGDSIFILPIKWGWETERNYCYHRKGGGVGKHLKHPVGTSRSYFPTWEEANAAVVARAELDLKNTIESIPRKVDDIAMLKKRTMRESYEI